MNAAPELKLSRRPAREHGFSLIEIIIAALLLTVVVVGATSVFASSTRSMSVSLIRDKQTSVANELLSKLQSDSSWAPACRRTFTVSSACDLKSWLAQPQFAGIGRVQISPDEQGTFQVTARATGLDLAADGVGASDKDGLRPDVFRLQVTIVPDQSLSKRFPTLRAMSIQQEQNPSIRVQTGRVTVNACIVINQVDERIPAGDCSGGGATMPLMPPPALNMASPFTTCRGPLNASAGSDQRDCIAYKCSHPVIARPDPGLTEPCSTFPSWSPGLVLDPKVQRYTTIQVRPASGNVTLTKIGGGGSWTRPLVNGAAQFTDLPIGSYATNFDVPGYRRWKSKSVPSSGEVSVEAGLNSRAVLMYRPNATATVRVGVSTLDATGPPWLQTTYSGYVDMSPDGALVEGGTEDVYLVPVPQGRLRGEDVPYTTVLRSRATTQFIFRRVEPGLYSFQMADADYTTFKTIYYTAGFLWVDANGTTFLGNTANQPEYIHATCAKNVRDQWVAGGPLTDPVSGLKWIPTSCSAPAGAAPPGGGGGGGAT